MGIQIEKHTFVSVRIDNVNNSRFFFRDVNDLRGKIITQIIMYLPDVTAIKTGPNGSDSISNANWTRGYLTMVDCNEVEFLSKIPFVALDYISRCDPNIVIKERVVNLSGCFIELPGAVGLVVDQEVFFSFYYKD